MVKLRPCLLTLFCFPPLIFPWRLIYLCHVSQAFGRGEASSTRLIFLIFLPILLLFCHEADQVLCYGRNGGVSSITLDKVTSSTWYPNVTWFTLFEELEELDLRDMQIGGGLQRENSNLIDLSMICLSIHRCFIQLYLLSHFQLNSYSLIHQVPNYFVHCSACRFVFVFFSTIC
jgi:hypothetical protein